MQSRQVRRHEAETASKDAAEKPRDGISPWIRTLLPQRAGRGERLDGRAQIGVGRETLEIGVVVQQYRSVVLCDGRDQAVKRWDAEMLMNCAELALELARSSFGALGDPEQREIARVDRRQIAASSCLEQQRRARVHEPSCDPLGDLLPARRIELWATETPERAGVEEQESCDAHARREERRMRSASARSGAGAARNRSTNVESRRCRA
jgi:hypothetical protein